MLSKMMRFIFDDVDDACGCDADVEDDEGARWRFVFARLRRENKQVGCRGYKSFAGVFPRNANGSSSPKKGNVFLNFWKHHLPKIFEVFGGILDLPL